MHFTRSTNNYARVGAPNDIPPDMNWHASSLANYGRGDTQWKRHINRGRIIIADLLTLSYLIPPYALWSFISSISSDGIRYLVLFNVFASNMMFYSMFSLVMWSRILFFRIVRHTFLRLIYLLKLIHLWKFKSTYPIFCNLYGFQTNAVASR